MAYTDLSYRFAVGTLYESDMQDVSKAVTAFPVQTDQALRGLPWWPPVDPSSVVSEVVEVFDALDGGRSGQGGFNFSWYFAVLTPDMVKYLRSTIFGTGFSALVTVVTWDRAYGWRYINCMALWNDPSKAATPGGLQGYLDLRIDFVSGTLAQAGWGFTNGFSIGFRAEG